MNIQIIFEDEYLVVLDKPAGVLVHPTNAGETNTLVGWFTEKYPEVLKSNWPDKTRIGVVHRLDKDTSGIIVMAKNPDILTKLQVQFKNRGVQKKYEALVIGKVNDKSGTITAAIVKGDAGLQKIQEISYSFDKKTVREAVTNYKLIKYYRFNNNDLTLLEVAPKTGRMHQIRVHLKYIGNPIIGDPLYNTKQSRYISKELELNRQFLHSTEILFKHPVSNDLMTFKSQIGDDLKEILGKLNEEK
jgi:23S rRNA pseudouridine1911/1915/1917 synthase